MPRTVRNNLLLSESLPSARFRIDPGFTYAGNTSFLLYNAAHVEQHHFVVADRKRRVERLLWFQFEGYLKNNEYRYRYTNMDTMKLNGLTFLHDADVLNIDEDYRVRPASDSAHTVDYLRQQGYTLEGDTMFKRLVWLESDLRDELMIIYSEDLRPTGLRISDLREGREPGGEWISISRSLHERALSSFEVEAD